MIKKIFILLLTLGLNWASAQNRILSCQGVHAVPFTSTIQTSWGPLPDTVYLTISGTLTIRANYNYNCQIQIPNLTALKSKTLQILSFAGF